MDLKLPGSEIEKASANIITLFAQSLKDLIDGYFRRWTISGNLRAEAEAQEEVADIKLRGAVRRARVVSAMGLEPTAKGEIDIEAMMLRAAGRLRSEFLLEQQNVDQIAEEAVRLASGDAHATQPRVIEDDWLLRFFQYAAKVDDAQLRAVMARALADAANADLPLTSARAIDTIRFFDPLSYEGFQFVALELTRWGLVPRAYFEQLRSKAPDGFDLVPLMELQLIKAERYKSAELQLGPVSFLFTYAPRETFAFELVSLTKIGREIAALLIPHVRERFETGPERITSAALWEIQQKLGLDVGHVKAIATAIVQEASDTWGLAYDIHLHGPGRQSRTLYCGAREAIDKPFGIPDLTEKLSQISDDRLLESCVQMAVNQFQYFDERQLPNFISEPFTVDTSRE